MHEPSLSDPAAGAADTRRNHPTLHTLVVVALSATLLGTVAAPATAASSARSVTPRTSATDATPCVDALLNPVTVLDTIKTNTRLAAGSSRTVSLPTNLAAADAVIATVVAKATGATTVTSSVASNPQVRQLVGVGAATPRVASTTVLIDVDNGQFTVTNGAAATQLVVNAMATVRLSADCASSLPGIPVLDTLTGINTPVGPVRAGETRTVGLTGDTLLPDALRSAVVSVSFTGSNVASHASLVANGTPVADFDIPAHAEIDELEVVPPTTQGTVDLVVDRGATDLTLTPIVGFPNAVAFNSEPVVLGTGTGPTVTPVALALPAKALDATAVFVAVSAQSSVGHKAVTKVWPTKATGARVTFNAIRAGDALRQVEVVRPTASKTLSVTVQGATSWDVTLLGWSSLPVTNAVADNVTLPAPTEVTADPANPNVLSYSGTDQLQPGDVIAVDPTPSNPEGTLSKVQAVVAPSAAAASRLHVATTQVQTVDVVPGTLGDAVPDADFSQSAAFDGGTADALPDLPPLPADVPPPPPNADGSPGGGAPAARASLAPATTSSTGGGTGGSRSFSCSAGAVASITASAGVYGNVNLSGSWGWFFRSPSVDFGISGGVHGNVQASVSGSATCNGSATIPGPTLSSLKFMVGSLPVWVTPVVSLTVSVSGSIGGSLQASAGFDANFSAGVRYADGSFSPYRDSSLTFPSSMQARAGGQIRVDVVPRLDLKIYGVAGPYVEVGGYAVLDASLGRTPWWYIDAGAEAGVGLVLDLGFHKYEYSLPRVELTRNRVAQASSAYPGPAGGGGNPGGGQVGAGFDRALSASGGTAPYRWYPVSGLLPPGLSLRTDGHIVGTPNRAGTWTLVVRVIDAAGNRVAADQPVTISIGNPPPPSADVSLARGPAAPAGYRYAVTLRNFPGNANVTITCHDSVDPQGFYTFSLHTDGSGYAFTQSYCYSGDHPSHWVFANGMRSNTVDW